MRKRDITSFILGNILDNYSSEKGHGRFYRNFSGRMNIVFVKIHLVF